MWHICWRSQLVVALCEPHFICYFLCACVWVSVCLSLFLCVCMYPGLYISIFMYFLIPRCLGSHILKPSSCFVSCYPAPSLVCLYISVLPSRQTCCTSLCGYVDMRAVWFCTWLIFWYLYLSTLTPCISANVVCICVHSFQGLIAAYQLLSSTANVKLSSGSE